MKQQAAQSSKQKHNSIGMMVISVAAAVIVIVSVVLLWLTRTAGVSNAERKAIRVGEESYSVAQMNFFYFSALDELLQNADGYTSILGLDTKKDLVEQPCPMSETGASWKDYLIQQAKHSLTKVHILCAEAEKQGIALDSAAQAEIDSELDYYQFLGQNAGYEDFDGYLTHTFGRGFHAVTLRGLLEKVYLADRFEQRMRTSFSFSDEQLEEYYIANEYLYTRYSYLFAYVDGSKDVLSICNELSGKTTQQSFEDAAKKLTGQECYHMTDVKGSELGDRSSADVVWLTTTQRQVGDTFIGKTEAAGYVLFFVGKNDNGFATAANEEWKVDATLAMQNDSFEAWLSEKTQSYAVKEYHSIDQVGDR
jgi:hypothetical protein